MLANPYLMPAIEHLRNCIILHVKVPVLSENMYFTCNDDNCLTGIFKDNQLNKYQKVSILDFIGDKYDEGGVDNWNYKTCKAAVKSSPAQTNTQLFTGRMPFLSPNHVKALKSITFHRPAPPSSPGHLPSLSLTMKGYLGESCQVSHQPSDASTPSISPAKCMQNNVKSRHLEAITSVNYYSHIISHLHGPYRAHLFIYLLLNRTESTHTQKRREKKEEKKTNH